MKLRVASVALSDFAVTSARPFLCRKVSLELIFGSVLPYQAQLKASVCVVKNFNSTLFFDPSIQHPTTPERPRYRTVLYEQGRSEKAFRSISGSLSIKVRVIISIDIMGRHLTFSQALNVVLNSARVST